MSEENQNDNSTTDNRQRKRGKRKNFIANAKKYAKKGQMGRGTKMPEELYQYFVGILDVIKSGIEDTEEKHALVNNVLERTKGEEMNVVGNQLGCRVIEILLPYSSADDLERFIEVLSPDLRRLCSDNFTSHVVETLLRVTCDRATEHLQTADNNDASDSEEEVPKKKAKKSKEIKTESKYPDEHLKNCNNFTLKLCKYALNNLEDFVWDQYANHILRSAIKCLSGITMLPGEKPKVNMFKDTKGVKGIPPHEKRLNYKVVPDEYKELVKEFAVRLSSWPQFKDLPYQNLTSALLQVLLYAVKNVDKNLCRGLLKQLLNDSFAPDDWVGTGNDEKKDKIEIDDENADASVIQKAELPPVFGTESAVRLLEAALFVSKKKMYTQIYAKCFINRLGQLATMPSLNFTVQRLIDNCQIKEEFEPMFEELSEKLGAVLASGNSGVLLALGKACLRIKAKQAQFVKALESTLQCSSPELAKYFPVLVLRLLPADRVDLRSLDRDYFIHIHGSVILQTILHFQRPAAAVQGLLELSGSELVVIFSDAKGCHVADAFCKGQFVGVKARDKLVWKLKGYYQKLALSQYGSRAFEQVFEACSLEQKVKVMTELADKASLLSGSPYGRLLASKLDVPGFKANQAAWEKHRKTIENNK